MTRPQGRLVALLLLLVTISGVAAYVAHRIMDPLRTARRVTGLDLPSETRLLHEERDWDGFLGDGYTLLVFEIPEGFSGSLLDACKQYGYETGSPVESGVHVPKVEQYLEPLGKSCHRFSDTANDTYLSVVESRTLVVYIAGQ